MSLKIGVVMDPIESITPYKDTTLAMLLAAQARGWKVSIMEQHQMYLVQGQPFATCRAVTVFDDNEHWFEAEDPVDESLADFDILLMRKDPPFNMDFIYTTYILERAAENGVLVGNRPNSLRDVNEKLFTSWFSQFCPTTLVTASSARLRAFIAEHKDAIIKPLDGMGGEGIYRLTEADPNISVILENVTHQDRRQIMAQRYVPEISSGDKRILVVDGTPVPFALARVPLRGETRGNLAAGGRGVPIALSERDLEIATTIGPELVKRGLLFVGLDVIGDYLTEVNVTSPTCVREIDNHMHSLPDAAQAINGYTRGIADDYLDALEKLHQA